MIGGAGVDFVDSTLRPRYRGATAVPIARARPSQLKATAMGKFRGETISRGGEIAKKQLHSTERAGAAIPER